MKKIILFLFVLVSNCFSQYIPQFLTQPPVGYQINLAHPDAQGLVRRWLFHEGSGSTLFDLSPNRNDGTLTNMDAATDWVSGRDGGWALDFDGTNDFIALSNAILFTGEFTISIWFLSRNNSQIGMFTGYTGGNEKFGILSGNFFVRVGVANDQTISVPAQNVWHQAVLTRNAQDKIDLFVDDGNPNRLFSDVAQVENMLIDSISNDDGSNEFNGLISDAILYDRALTAKEVMSNFIYQFAMFEQPPGRILAVAAAAAAIDRMRLIIANP